MPLFEKAGIAESLDDGCVSVSGDDSVAGFVAMLGELRFWEREAGVDADA